VHAEVAFNYRMTALQAAFGVAQMTRLPELLAKKRAMGERYRAGLADVPGLVLPPAERWCGHTYWMFGVLVEPDFGMGRDALMEGLRAAGVETRYFFTPIHRQPFLEGRGRVEGAFPVSDRLGASGLYLPSGTTLADEQIDAVCEAVRTLARS
jgi:perosamine synthetase